MPFLKLTYLRTLTQFLRNDQQKKYPGESDADHLYSGHTGDRR